MDKAQIFASLTKVDVAKQLVYGIATEEVTDKSGEKFDYTRSKPHFEEWSGAVAKAAAAIGAESLGNVRAMHGKVAAGKLTEITYDDDAKKISVCAHIVDQNEWNKVLKGVYTGFSIGGSYVDKWDDADEPTVKRYEARPSEISIVDNPCVHNATFTAIKADGSEELVKFTPWTPTNAEIEAEAIVLAKAAEGVAPDFLDAAREALIKAHTTDDLIDETAKTTEQQNADEAAALAASSSTADLTAASAGNVTGHAKADEATDWGIDQVFQVKADKSVHATKAIAKAHVEAMKVIEAGDQESPVAKALKAALAKAEGDDKTASPKPYGDVAYADPEDGKYPIDTPAHIRAAWSYVNQEKNAKTLGDKLDAVKAKIVAAWKDKIDADGPPSAEKMAAIEGLSVNQIVAIYKAVADQRLAKGFWTVTDVSRALECLSEILMSVCWEETMEHDSASKLPQMADDAFNAVRTLLVEMISEESGELTSALTANGATAEITLLEGWPVFENAAAVGELIKVDADTLAKIGARTSKVDKARMQAIHDHATEMGAACEGSDKAAGDELAKVVAERDGLQKQVSEALEGIEKVMAVYEARLAKVEAQPEALPRPDPGKLVTKGGAPITGDLDAQSIINEISKHYSPKELGDMMFKAALQHPTLQISPE